MSPDMVLKHLEAAWSAPDELLIALRVVATETPEALPFEEIAHVLNLFYGDEGFPPGGYGAALLQAVVRAGAPDLVLLARAYPLYVGLVHAMKVHREARDVLRAALRSAQEARRRLASARERAGSMNGPAPEAVIVGPDLGGRRT